VIPGDKALLDLPSDAAGTAAATRSLAPAVDNAFAILGILAGRPRGAGVSDIARELGLSKSSCFNILSTLLRQGAVEKRGDSAAWHLGPKLVELGTAARRGYSGRAAVRTLLQTLADREQLVCLVGQVLGAHAGIVVLDRVFPRGHPLDSVNVPIGEVYPLTAPAMGRAVLAAYDDDEALVLAQSLKGYAAKARQAELLAALKTVRAKGYALSLEEYEPGVRAVAAVLPGYQVDPSLVLCLVGRAAGLGSPRLAKLGAVLRETATQAAALIEREGEWA
jgi:DNA-binding IclR family transcriptional regulator